MTHIDNLKHNSVQFGISAYWHWSFDTMQLIHSIGFRKRILGACELVVSIAFETLSSAVFMILVSISILELRYKCSVFITGCNLKVQI